MRYREIVESLTTHAIGNTINQKIDNVKYLQSIFSALVNAKGYRKATEEILTQLNDIKGGLWYLQVQSTATPKLKATYNKLQVAIQQLEEKIKSGI